MAWLWTILCVLTFLSLLKALFSHKKKLPPGPRALPIIGHLHLIGQNAHQDLARLARKHGPIMGLRFGSVPVLVISSPSHAEQVLKTHDLIFASRPQLLVARYISYEQRDLVFGPYGQYWREMRKLCVMELLSLGRINNFRSMRQAEVVATVSRLRGSAERGEVVDLSQTANDLIGDMISFMVLGRKFGDDGDMDMKNFRDVLMEAVEFGGKFNLGDYFPLLGWFDVQGLTRKMKALHNVFDGILEKVIDDQEKRGESDRSNYFVDTMMSLLKSGKVGFEFDRGHVKAVLLDMLVAGINTTVSIIEWTLSELMMHPEMMKKLSKELETVVGLDNMVEESDIEKLHYLDLVIKESLRLHPTAPLMVPHESMEDCVLDGYYIPKKSRVLVNLWRIGRDPNVWHDAETFSPDRFLGKNIDIKGHDFQLIPFGTGRRSCPGMHLGLTMANFIVAQLLHCFDWQLPNGMKPNELDMSEHFGLVMGRAKRLTAIPTYRLSI